MARQWPAVHQGPGARIVAGLLWTLTLPTSAAGDPPARVTEVFEPAPTAAIIGDLESQLHQLGSPARVEHCEIVLDYVQPAPSGKDSSWGAVCTITVGTTTKTILACDDWMIGKFSLTENFSNSRPAVAEFIALNCPPGG